MAAISGPRALSGTHRPAVYGPPLHARHPAHPRRLPRRPAAAPGQRPLMPPPGLAAGAPPQRFSPTSVLPLLSASVEAAAELSVWEQFAGRSAMVRPPHGAAG